MSCQRIAACASVTLSILSRRVWRLAFRPGAAQILPVTSKNPPCPWLPDVSEIHNFSITRRHGHAKGVEFYLDTLRYAQSQWLAGKPAQAVLQLNKAWMADLSGEEPVLRANPPPYQALAWILETAADGQCGYLGNPVRHFQHLASRMSGPRAEIRSWRAWVCFHLAERILERAQFPRDGEQIAREGLWIPSDQQARNEVVKNGWPGECGFRPGQVSPPPPGQQDRT